MVAKIITLVIGFIMAFYVMSSTYQPLEDAAVTLRTPLGGAINGESLGTADATGYFTAAVANPPVLPGSVTVYADGVANGSWVNATASAVRADGNISAIPSGFSNTTQNAAITIDYQHDPEIANIENIGGLPAVAVLLLVLVILVGFMVTATKNSGL